ncbi:major facilitator superfamily domain-containing protein [Phthorimaea operculella]|nr:major facilitator superfamily domain-containing protein [Phthorimaea operculella]
MDGAMGEKRALDKDKWGWAVCFGNVITFIAGIGHVTSFGLIYKDFMKETNSSAKSLTTAHGIFAIMLAIGGIVLNIMSKKYSLRSGGFVGAFIMLLGSFSNIFISSTNQLSITFGVLHGIGFGMMVPVCYATINHYFVNKRTTVLSSCKAVQGLILMWYPQLIKKILFSYGFRGTLLLVFGISLHTLPGMAVMKIQNRQYSADMKTANEAETRLNDPEKPNNENSDDVDDDKAFNCKKGGSNIRQELLKMVNIKVLKDFVYCNICIGQSFMNFSDLTFFMLQPLLLFQYGYDTSQVAACISTCVGADVAGRCALAIFSNIFHINTRLLFYVSTLLTLVFRLVIIKIRQFTWMLILTGTLGVLRAWLHVASPLVISNHVTHQDFPGAYALFTLSTGIVNVAFAPVVGLLKDVYEDYTPAFYLLSACCLPCLILWPIEYLVTRR